jgi:archaellum component FlaF (FlaF/FlaG flagellin family)
MADLFTPAKQQTHDSNRLPIVIGLVAVLVVVGVITIVVRHQSRTTPQANPYAAKLQLSNPKLSAAENYVGGTVTYLDVDITNNGDQALVGADMKMVFKNTLNQIVQTETLPVHVLAQNQMGGYPDLVDLERSPVAPGQTKTVRLTLEHISADWNQSAPEMQLVNLKLKGN